ncbi:hypothetical protein J3D55_000625 [Chryseobacterium ginsenosidimutans]|jgi:hypothetical protein|uniref:hypothetical protein n=1 Tax=Chryseobacterium ginsenosidimutans TaxID=687846 RepID=UPI0021672D0F|nr:hypothetical protein [Chryseobacterium ginsenosidimutans]MCS3867709.1 hypothetical protein [Chryseobacterium ginsenosidimutans]
MKHIKNNEFLFTDEDGQKRIFLREKYFDFVCQLITDFFEKKIIQNEFYDYFVNLLNDLEDYEGVDFINHQIPLHWALCIIQNKHTIDSFTAEEYERFKIFSLKFKKQNNITSIILDYNIST